MKFAPKFYPNLADNNHCLQAAVMMVLRTINGKASWDDVNAVTQYENGSWSWVSAAALALADQIEGVKYYSVVDYEQFIKRGEEYFKQLNDSEPEWFEVQKEHASPGFNKERRIASELLQRSLVEHRVVSKKEIEEFLRSNMIIALVDAGHLAQKNQRLGHVVLVYDQSAENFVLHDPGLPPRQQWAVKKDLFMIALQGEVVMIPKGNLDFGMDVGRNDPCPCGSGKKYKRCHA